jgi:putative hydrolase of the HAD superfamily
VAIELLGVDADDTLWHSEVHFEFTQQRVRELVAPWVEAADFDERLLATERRNLRLFGYGVKGFALSTIETVIELTEGRIPASDIHQIISVAKSQLDHPIELLAGVEATVAALAVRYRLVLITKGDLFHQEAKVAASGLGERFEGVEVVAEKDPATYRRLLHRYGADPANFAMIGNSLRSDILPALELGGFGVHIPYALTWAHEVVDLPSPLEERLVRLERFEELPEALARL